MQADVILKEPPTWMPPLSLSGGARLEGGGGARPPPSSAPERSICVLGDYGDLMLFHYHVAYKINFFSKMYLCTLHNGSVSFTKQNSHSY